MEPGASSTLVAIRFTLVVPGALALVDGKSNTEILSFAQDDSKNGQLQGQKQIPLLRSG
jgi:hypothetical protein